MIKKYNFEYGFHDAYITFEVDTEKFTPEMAQATLDFFTWEYDKKADPVDEVMKKYAIQALYLTGYVDNNAYGVIQEFKDCEGYAPVDGSMGIKVLHFKGMQLNEEELTVEVES